MISITTTKIENISEIKKLLENKLSQVNKRNAYIYFLKKLVKDNNSSMDISSNNNKAVFSIPKIDIEKT